MTLALSLNLSAFHLLSPNDVNNHDALPDMGMIEKNECELKCGLSARVYHTERRPEFKPYYHKKKKKKKRREEEEMKEGRKAEREWGMEGRRKRVGEGVREE
jgi:hypothetical protein